MAFQDALKILFEHEGKYSNDPLDRGGETYRGIARKRWPKWPGWAIVDAMKDFLDFPECLDRDAALSVEVMKFYKEHFWAPIRGDEIPEELAVELFETQVNSGRGVEFLQHTLNFLNRNGQAFPDLKIDNDFGPATMSALNLVLKTDGLKFLLAILNRFQAKFYFDLMLNDPSQERFARGWLKRTFS